MMLSGKDRGKIGKVVKVARETSKVIVEGLNLIKRHVRARRQGQKGQIIAKERMIALSSVALVCPSCGKPTRVGFHVGTGKNGAVKTRMCKKCKAEIA